MKTGDQVNSEVKVGVNEIIDLDLEGFLDLLEELVNADFEEPDRGLINGLEYKLIGTDLEEQSLVFSVSGEFISNNEEEE